MLENFKLLTISVTSALMVSLLLVRINLNVVTVLIMPFVQMATTSHLIQATGDRVRLQLKYLHVTIPLPVWEVMGQLVQQVMEEIYVPLA